MGKIKHEFAMSEIKHLSTLWKLSVLSILSSAKDKIKFEDGLFSILITCLMCNSAPI